MSDQSKSKKTTHSNIDLLNTAFLDGANASYIEAMYAEYVKNPNAVEKDLADFFKSLGDPANDVKQNAQGASWEEQHWPLPNNDAQLSLLDYGHIAQTVQKATDKAKTQAKGTITQEDMRKIALGSIRAIMLVRAYRVRGHLIADLDPLKLSEKEPHPELEPSTYGLDINDPTKIFLDGVLGLKEASVAEIIEILHRTYGGTFAIEFMHIYDPEEKSWLQKRIERADPEIKFTNSEKKTIFKKLVQAEGFEKFLHTKYMGTKRFGLDGGESLIPGMEQMMVTASNLGVVDIVFGMPHRGRLNVLSAVMEKPYVKILNEFQGGSANPEDIGGSGDVKYHLGASGDRTIDGKNLHLSLVANPSHLEAVNPVVIGKVRAKQEFYNSDRTKVMPVLLHGDAAFAGQGVVAECLALSGLDGYGTGGTLHIIVNNQIGFTTAPHLSRSSPYPSDVAKTVQAPIFHVNGDDPEAVAFAFKVAVEYRQKFGKDVVVDMVCYRRYGHNEGDEPSFTQPLMYDKIRSMETVLSHYKKQLLAHNIFSQETIDAEINSFNDSLQQAFEEAKNYKPNKADWLDGRWGKMQRAEGTDSDAFRGKTGVEIETLNSVGGQLTAIPDDFELHRTLKRQMTSKRKMFETGKNIDWATAEALAFGTLLKEGFPVRLSGQDSGRGTFSQRHARLVDQKTEESFYPLKNISPDQEKFQAIDSALSEFAVLGFEYGYTWEDPNSLTLWEAQFGDFANGAQVMVDQFICSAETKWLRMSGLVMLLPHGYEGQGPEHSSARLERYLQLCAEDNMQVANCTTPANYFHILRRQMHRNFRKPLIIMTPKSLLRHKYAVSSLADMSVGTTFHRILPDHADHAEFDYTLNADADIKRVVMCSGKVYYDLLEARQEQDIKDVYLLRLEQIYPFPAKTLIHELSRFPQAQIIWCQEEPRNMGAWSFVDYYIEWVLDHVKNAATKRARYIGRASAASTATGLASKHKIEQDALISEALTVK
ncbi:MAG: 2-oxoglutarate dehydrogenase E1 component [Alphaproteobacteria bacterium]|jgi:2-oxoglutarate dehydrogenase E1 component